MGQINFYFLQSNIVDNFGSLKVICDTPTWTLMEIGILGCLGDSIIMSCMSLAVEAIDMHDNIMISR